MSDFEPGDWVRIVKNSYGGLYDLYQVVTFLHKDLDNEDDVILIGDTLKAGNVEQVYHKDDIKLVRPKDITEPDEPNKKGTSDGGPTGYYDFPPEWKTTNDYIEYKSKHQWKEHSFHLGNITKALTRWGEKDGTTIEYDAKKILYSIVRVMCATMGKKEAKAYVLKMMEDKQFE